MTPQNQIHQLSNTDSENCTVIQNPYYNTPDTETTSITFSFGDSEVESQRADNARQNMSLRNTEIITATTNIYYTP